MTSVRIDSRDLSRPPYDAGRVLAGPYAWDGSVWYILFEITGIPTLNSYGQLQAWHSEDDGATWDRVNGPSTDALGVTHYETTNDQYGVAQSGANLAVAYFGGADADADTPEYPMYSVVFSMATSSWGSHSSTGYSVTADVAPNPVVPVLSGGSTHYYYGDWDGGAYRVRRDGSYIDSGGGDYWYLCHAWTAGDGREHAILAKVTATTCDLYHYSGTLTSIGAAWDALDIPWVAACDYDDSGTQKIAIAYQRDTDGGIVVRRGASADSPGWGSEELVSDSLLAKAHGHEQWSRLVAVSSTEIYFWWLMADFSGFTGPHYTQIYQSKWDGASWSAPALTDYDHYPVTSGQSLHIAQVSDSAIGIGFQAYADYSLDYWQVPIGGGAGPAARYYSF